MRRSMASDPICTILQNSQISPTPATIGHRSLPLNFFDIAWLPFPPVQHLFFYDFPYSKSHFIETIIPNLKHSLSVTLQHFFTFVSNLIVFPHPNHNYAVVRTPEIRHVEGDSVAFIIAECSLDYDELTRNHPRRCDYFYPLVPPLGSAVKASDYISVPLFSVQVTVFPGSGFSIGMTNHHCLGDASTRFCFLKAWSTIAASGGDDLFLASGSLPIYDRLIHIPNLDENKLRLTKLGTFYHPPSLVGPTDKVRATFVLTRTNIDFLKNKVLTKVPKLEYISSFTVTCGYIWSCIIKTFVKMGEKKGEEELEQFVVTIDCRSRLDPPIPSTYMGNCAAPCIVAIKWVVLSGEDGFVIAAKLIGEAIKKMVNNKDGILKDAARWHEGFMVPARKIGVAGTLKLDFYDTDFGWGKPRKFETVSIDHNGSISVNRCKESTQDFEIGLSLSGMQMEAFANIFRDGLSSEISS